MVFGPRGDEGWQWWWSGNSSTEGGVLTVGLSLYVAARMKCIRAEQCGRCFSLVPDAAQWTTLIYYKVGALRNAYLLQYLPGIRPCTRTCQTLKARGAESPFLKVIEARQHLKVSINAARKRITDPIRRATPRTSGDECGKMHVRMCMIVM